MFFEKGYIISTKTYHLELILHFVILLAINTCFVEGKQRRVAAKNWIIISFIVIEFFVVIIGLQVNTDSRNAVCNETMWKSQVFNS